MEEQEQIEIKNISDESVQEQSENKIEAKQKKQGGFNAIQKEI